MGVKQLETGRRGGKDAPGVGDREPAAPINTSVPFGFRYLEATWAASAELHTLCFHIVSQALMNANVENMIRSTVPC